MKHIKRKIEKYEETTKLIIKTLEDIEEKGYMVTLERYWDNEFDEQISFEGYMCDLRQHLDDFDLDFSDIDEISIDEEKKYIYAISESGRN